MGFERRYWGSGAAREDLAEALARVHRIEIERARRILKRAEQAAAEDPRARSVQDWFAVLIKKDDLREGPETRAADGLAPGRQSLVASELAPPSPARSATLASGRQSLVRSEAEVGAETRQARAAHASIRDEAPPEPERLDVAQQWRMSQAFGFDFSGVSIHRDSPLATGAMRALVKDTEIHFRRGAYAPGTPAGDRLIAHELAHIVQQRASDAAGDASHRELEREADRAAALVARGHAAPIALRAQLGATYAFSDEEDHDGDIGTEPEATLRVSRSWIDALAGSTGRPLPAELRTHLESSLEADLHDVRIHDGPISDAGAREIHARAFTLGKDIHFAHGQFDPETRTGRELIAHEVAHAAQQGAAGDFTGATLGSPGEPLELEAERFAREFVCAEATAPRTDGSGARRSAPRPPLAQIAPVALGSASSPVVHRDVGWARRGPFPDPYGMGYNQICRAPALPRSPRCEISRAVRTPT